jgi:flagellar protein FliO/FliZ
MMPTLSSLLAFAGIVVAIPLVLWLLKRSPYGAALGGGAARAALPMRTLGSLPLGPQQRVVTIEVGEGAARRWLVLGVTPHHVGTLHVLEAPPEDGPGAAAAAAPAMPFAALLKNFQRGGGDAR